jgi:hypothetical protein
MWLCPAAIASADGPSGSNGAASPALEAPTTVTRGEAVPVSGTGFQPGERVRLTLSGRSLGSIESGADGSFATEVTIPDAAPAEAALGKQRIVATGTTSHLETDLPLTIQGVTKFEVVIGGEGGSGGTLTTEDVGVFGYGGGGGGGSFVWTGAAFPPDPESRLLIAAGGGGGGAGGGGAIASGFGQVGGSGGIGGGGGGGGPYNAAPAATRANTAGAHSGDGQVTLEFTF